MDLLQVEHVIRCIESLIEEAKKTDYFAKDKGPKTYDYFAKDKPSKPGKTAGGVSGRDKTKGANRKRPVNRSTMYKHMTVAIYDAIKGTGYARDTDAEAARMIARGQMVKHGYARRGRSKATGKVDRRAIKLTGKGKRRSSKHARESAGELRRKEKKFAKISAMK